jgi:hypothetical protein
MDPEGEVRTKLDSASEIRVFTCGLVVRGFDLDEGLPVDTTCAVIETELDMTSIPGGIQ